MPGSCINPVKQGEGSECGSGEGGCAEKADGTIGPSGLGRDDSPEGRWDQPIEQATMLLSWAGPQWHSQNPLHRQSADIL